MRRLRSMHRGPLYFLAFFACYAFMHLVLLLSRVLGLLSSSLCGIIYSEVKGSGNFPKLQKMGLDGGNRHKPAPLLTVLPIEKGISYYI